MTYQQLPRRPDSPVKVAAKELLDRLVQMRTTIQDIDSRGGILRLMDDAKLSDAARERVAGAIGFSWRGLRSYVVQIGDDRRANGKSVELCELPEEQERTMPGPLPGKRDDGKPWFE